MCMSRSPWYVVRLCDFNKLVHFVTPYFHIGHTNYRQTIVLLERLTVTIR
jgi:hypothetical protein